MTYEETPVSKKIDGKAVNKNSRNLLLSKVSTGAMIWFIIKRHKFGIAVTWAVFITICYMMPFVPDMILSALVSL